MDEQQITEEQGHAGGNGRDDNRPQVLRAGSGGGESRPRVLRAGSGGDESRPRVLRAGRDGEGRHEAHGRAEASPLAVHAQGESAHTGAWMVLQSGVVLSTCAQQVLTEWIGYSQQAPERNSRALGELIGCRTAKDVVDLQLNLFEANVEAWLHAAGAVFQISAEKAREAADRMREVASRSAW